jgi:hypothetical protein
MHRGQLVENWLVNFHALDDVSGSFARIGNG